MTALGGAREVSSAAWWVVCVESSMEAGSNMKVLVGLLVGQESGMALRLSSVAGALISCFEVEEGS